MIAERKVQGFQVAATMSAGFFDGGRGDSDQFFSAPFVAFSFFEDGASFF